MLAALEWRFHSLAPTECHYACLWQRSEVGPRRHAEDEENDDGWSAALVVLAEVFVFARVVLAIPHQGETCGDRWSRLLAHQKRTRVLGVTEPDCCVQHFVPAILDSRKPDF